MSHQLSNRVSIDKDNSNDTLQRQAALIASGQSPFPEELEPEAQAELAELVIQIRRERVLRYLTRSIAADLLQTLDP